MTKNLLFKYDTVPIGSLSENATFVFENVFYRVTSKKLPVPVVINKNAEVPLISAHIAETKNAYKSVYFTPDTIVKILK